MQLAYDYFGEAALIDLGDIAQNTKEGLHIASLSGAWMAVVAGFGGLRDHNGGLELAPRLPPGLKRICFRINYRPKLLRVDIGPDEAHCAIADGKALESTPQGQPVPVEHDTELRVEIPMLEAGPEPRQLMGRAPARP